MKYNLPIRSIVPNAVTILSLSAGLTGLKYAFLGKWEAAVIAVLIAGVLDGLDGRVARLLKGATNFGAELDSLVDFVNFGVVPAMIMYMWVLKDVKGVGWFFALLFAVCMVLRLARFNTMNKDKETNEEIAKNFFIGVPAPAAAALVLWPMILFFETGGGIFNNPYFCIFYMGVMAFLTISRLPTFSFKGVKIKREHALFYLLLVCFVGTMLVTFTWITLSVLGFSYLCLLPFSFQSMRTLKRKQSLVNEEEGQGDKTFTQIFDTIDLELSDEEIDHLLHEQQEKNVKESSAKKTVRKRVKKPASSKSKTAVKRQPKERKK